MSAARQAVLGASGGAAERRSEGGPSPVIPLLVMVLGLAIATIWFVALPALETPPPGRTCEVVFRKDGTTKCVEKPTGTAKKHKPSRPKR
jgi:hypothetical protein